VNALAQKQKESGGEAATSTLAAACKRRRQRVLRKPEVESLPRHWKRKRRGFAPLAHAGKKEKKKKKKKAEEGELRIADYCGRVGADKTRGKIVGRIVRGAATASPRVERQGGKETATERSSKKKARGGKRLWYGAGAGNEVET